MHKSLILFIVFLSVIINVGKCASRAKRVVGGFPAEPGQFPYQVSIKLEDGSHYCGGSIISKRFIVTAGHCVHNKHPKNLYIVAGTNELSDEPTQYKIQKIIKHGLFNYNKLQNDIALIQVETDIEFTDLIQPIPLELESVPSNVKMTVSGWGLKDFKNKESPNYLQYEELVSFSYEDCKNAYFSDIKYDMLNEHNFCTFTKKGEGVCYGDSGGPLVYDGKLVGVVSWGTPCAVGYPDIFTKISFYFNWIESAMTQITDNTN